MFIEYFFKIKFKSVLFLSFMFYKEPDFHNDFVLLFPNFK
ncbi:hypothetical protein SAMN05444280_106124 [Tangfeifania diversioriginum]|uniref:Uncharacterized protein n=1 Tax=Tangfeifania diversioriginum TaxID=1168035 RepID=A0A1M6EAA0_9BACT|nr:hypothetical protein SAMN05444280_106124 [Tangfeifania diversioriginum]